MQTDNFSFDLIVVGGGSAGVAAAYSAAKQGAKVALLEKKPFSGGRATDTFVGTMCGLYFRNEQDDFTYSSDGFLAEFAEKLKELSNTSPIRTKNGNKFLPYKQPAFVFLCDKLLTESGVQTFYHTTVIGVETNEDSLSCLSAFHQNKKYSFLAKSFIDASGTALLQTLAGKTPIQDEEYQQSHFSVRVSGVEGSDIQELKLALVYALKKAEQAGRISTALSFTSLVPGQTAIDNIWLKIPITQTWSGTTTKDIGNLSAIEIEARSNAQLIVECLKAFSPLFSNTAIAELAFETGVRITERNQGKEILRKEDVLGAIKRSDSSIKATWPIEIWQPGKPVIMEYFAENDYYSIPNETLTSPYYKNLFFVGRNISADSGAIASARVIGTCLQMGETVAKWI